MSLMFRSRLVVARATAQKAGYSTRQINRVRMGQRASRVFQGDGEKKEGKGKGKGEGEGKRKLPFHPLAVIGGVSLLVSGYKLVIEPYFDWQMKQDKKEAEKRSVNEKAERKKRTETDVAAFPFASKTVVFVLGGPGSGKGTNSTRLVDDFGFVHLSAGDLLREEEKDPDSEYGELVGYYIREGLIVPHEITIALLRNAMMNHPESDRFLIDGFPRNLEQAKAFEDTVCRAKKILYFECPEATLLQRLLRRGKTSGRSDDNMESIVKRFHTYTSQSKPVIDNYAEEGKVMTVQCTGTMDEVYESTRKQVAEFLKAQENK